MNEGFDIIDSSVGFKKGARRRLLPWWIKVFSWIFMILGALVPLSFIVEVFQIQTAQIGLYGLYSGRILSVFGLISAGVMVFKAIVSWMLWTEKDQAIEMGKYDVLIGVLICLFSMFVIPFIDNKPGLTITFRLEIVFLLLFYYKLKKIERAWKFIEHTSPTNE